MPKCLALGCRNPAVRGGSRCRDHGAYRSGHAPHSDYGAAYRAQRTALLASHPLCHWCKQRPATEADHDPPLAQGGDHSRMVPSCRRCNRSRTPRGRTG
jgi:hypothetical protein